LGPKHRQETFVVYVEPERLRRGVQIGAIDKERDAFGRVKFHLKVLITEYIFSKRRGHADNTVYNFGPNGPKNIEFF
jgi:hypothetical protein